MRLIQFALLAAAAVTAVACGGTVPSAQAPQQLGAQRTEARSSSDPEVVGRWLLAEMWSPGGNAKGAAEARKKLDKANEPGLYAGLARGVFDEAHGEPKSSADSFVSAVLAAKTSKDPDAALIAWFSTHHLLALRSSVTDLFGRHKAVLDGLIASPGNIGWRAVAELMEWSTAEAFDKADVTGDAYDALVASRMGCAKSVRIAGPFGQGTPADRRRSFAAENNGPWPPSWPADPMRNNVPHVLKTEQHRCLAASTERSEDGIFYAETFVTAPADRDVLVAVQGAVKVWVDDVPIVTRDLREWGVWQRFGGAVHVSGGRHRVLARLLNDAGSIRLLNLDGTAADVATDTDARPPYGLVPPRVLADPNPIDAIVRARAARSPLLAVLSSYAAHLESMHDVANVLIDPLVSPDDAAPLVLELSAIYTRGDPALPDDVRHRVEMGYHARAVALDPKLWYSSAWLILDEADQKGLIEAVEPMRKLVGEFPNEPEITEQLARLYARLGWRAERMRALTDLAKRFPDDVNAQRLYLGALEEDGTLAEADKVAARVKKLDPDAELDLDRAIARQDWKAAISELERLQKRRPDRKEIAGKIADVLLRAGDPSAAAEQLRKALAKNPEDSTARFRLADRAYAKGDTTALRRALAEALQAGAKGGEIRDAVELLEGASALEPYRVDGREVIKEFEQWEKTGKHMDGNAARVLDYAATWVHPDGSSEMLEHEIMRIQSQEVIGKEAEQQPPAGLVLRLRVLKPDGSVLEPEPVAGKPTLTMPHLEVGDYIEIEHISSSPSEGAKGKRYHGPHWFFREADKGYWRSEFVTITPKDRPLEIETRGTVAAPTEKDKGTFVERRWRVEESPPAPDEPDSAPQTEFLPSVRIGWGVSLEDTLVRLVDLANDETPLDPRLEKKAVEIVHGIPEAQRDERARLAYRHVVENIEDGQENDGRKVLMGKSGSRQAAFQYLLRLLKIPVEMALVKNRLAMPPLGKMSEVENYDSLVLRVGTDRGVRWLTVRDKFAPYGYVPAELRGQTAIRLIAGTPREVTTNAGAADGVVFEGRADLREDGSAGVELALRYTGKLAIGMRNVFDKVPEGQRHDFVESRLLSRNLPGARLRDLKIENKEDLGSPIVVRVRADVPQLARSQGAEMSLKALFPMHLAQIATLPERQTPLLLGSSSHVEVHFQIVVPESIKMPSSLPGGEVHDGERSVRVQDEVHGHAIHLERAIDIPAGRVQPGKEYAALLRFVQQADTLVEREILLGK